MTNNKMMKSVFRGILIFCFITFYISSCANEDTTVSCVPVSNVSAIYDLNLPLFTQLRIPQSYVVLESDGTNGSRGVILFNTGNGYVAYDRNAPHMCPTTNSTLMVRNDIIIECPEDGAQWSLRSGEPLNNQTNGRSPRHFYVTLSGNQLIITN